jgi:phosphoribosylformimino-5-aminoimidazole carboxamide ribotide isomerase
MEIFPAIDIKNAECVRLLQGDFKTAEKVAEDPLHTARFFESAGAR